MVARILSEDPNEAPDESMKPYRLLILQALKLFFGRLKHDETYNVSRRSAEYQTTESLTNLKSYVDPFSSFFFEYLSNLVFFVGLFVWVGGKK